MKTLDAMLQEAIHTAIAAEIQSLANVAVHHALRDRELLETINAAIDRAVADLMAEAPTQGTSLPPAAAPPLPERLS